MARLAGVIEFLAHARADLRRHFPRIDDGVEAPVQREQDLKLAKIGLDGRFHIRILQLAGERCAVLRAGAMHLAERGRRRRMQIEALKACAPVWSELRLHPPPDEAGAHRRGVGLELLQFLGIFRGQERREWSPASGRLSSSAP